MTFGPILSLVLGAVAVIGVITSTLYSLMVAVGVRRFRHRVAAAAPHSYQPQVSVLKPLHGDEPDLEENLASFFQQDYPEFEIIFCARHSDDLGLAAARRVAARFPLVPTRILTCGEPPWPNARTFSLEIMRREARHPILVTSDSDVRIAPDYLASIVAPLADPKVGMVTCLYRGVTRHGLWAQLEAMGMSLEMTSGVLVAEMIEGMRFALGPSMVMRQSTVEKIGGFESFSDYLADDYQLGHRLHALGLKCVLSDVMVETHLGGNWHDVWQHQVRWARTIRVSKFWGYLGLPVTFATFWAIVCGNWRVGLALLAVRMLMAIVAGKKDALRMLFLIPLRDLFGVAVWTVALFGNTVVWRGRTLRLDRDGRIS